MTLAGEENTRYVNHQLTLTVDVGKCAEAVKLHLKQPLGVVEGLRPLGQAHGGHLGEHG